MENGRELTIARYTTGDPADITAQRNATNYSFICGARSRSFDIAAEQIDTTVANCIDPSLPVVTTSENGRQNRQFQVDGLMINNAAGKAMLEDGRLARTPFYLISVPGWGDFSGRYRVSISLSGDLDGKMTYNATFNLSDGSTEDFEAEA